MKNDRRKTKNTRPKTSRFFYLSAIFIFVAIAFLTTVNCFLYGFTDERVAMMLLNMWFTLFTMDIFTKRFQRTGERARWHDWVIFSKQEAKETSSNESSQEDHSNTNKKAL